MDLREALAGVALFRYEAHVGPSQPAQIHLRKARSDLRGHALLAGYNVRVSGSAQNLPEIPWIAILDPEVTTTARRGLYVVYLYDKSLARVYLTMNQGATAHDEHAREIERGGKTIADWALDNLAGESDTLRAELPESLTSGTDRAITLGSDRFLPQAYEKGTIAAVEYDLAALPPVDVLEADLTRFLLIYQAATEARTRLAAWNPEEFLGRTLSRRPAPLDADELFRPKDSSDYIATVTARTQHKSRRHEAIVRNFGEYARTRAWTPITAGAHPRDLLLRQGERELLCEVKVAKANATDPVREAIGQLFTYRHFLYRQEPPPDGLVAVFSDEIGHGYVELLESLGIASVWLNGSTWRGSTGASAFGLT